MMGRGLIPKVAITVWAILWACLATIVLFLPVILCAFFSRTGNLAFTLSKLWANIMLWVTFVKVEIVGKEKITKGQSYIIVSNHQSAFDILAIVTTLGIQFRWVIKKELLKVPLFGYALYASRNIFIDRSNSKRAIESINRGVERLHPGTGVIFFAEGTRSRDGKIHDFKKGAFVMAVARRLPILPITVSGSRKIMQKGSLMITPGKIRMVVADPIEPDGYSEQNLDELLKSTRDTIIANFIQ
jgi:1-acyl-sn-glycerol-3-phosphate acyltransferase